MPKELIFRDYLKIDNAARHPAVKVGWDKNGPVGGLCVQVAVLADEDDPDEQDALHVDLTRSMINKLIRTLRSARDQAYGRDE